MLLVSLIDFYFTSQYTTNYVVYADGYNWYKIVLPGGSDEAWIAGSLIGY